MGWIKSLDKWVQRRAIEKKAEEIRSSLYAFATEWGIDNQDDLISKKGAAIYREMIENDPEVKGALKEITMSVLGVPWSITPGDADDDKAAEIAEFVDRVFRDLGSAIVAQNVYSWLYEAVSLPIMQGNLVAEINWTMAADRVVIDNIKSKVPEDYDYGCDDSGNLKYVRFNPAGIWVDLTPDKLFIVPWLPLYANWHGNSELRCVYGYYMLSKICIQQAIIYAQKRSGGMWTGKYPANNKSLKTALEAALKNAASSNYIVYPDGAEIAAITTASGSEGAFWSQIDEWSKRKIRRAILGITTTAEASRSGDAGGQSSRDESVKEPLIQFISDNLCDQIRKQLIMPLVKHNFGEQEYYPEFTFSNRKATAREQATRNAIIAYNMGKKIPISYFVEECGIPEPEDGEEFLHRSQRINPLGGNGTGDEPPMLPDNVGGDMVYAESRAAKTIRLDHRQVKRDLDALETEHRNIIADTVQRIGERMLSLLDRKYETWKTSRNEINGIELPLIGRIQGQFRRLARAGYQYGDQTAEEQIERAKQHMRSFGFGEDDADVPTGAAYTVPADVADAVGDYWSARFGAAMRAATTEAFWAGFQAGESRQQIADRFRTTWEKFGGQGEPDKWYDLNRQIRNATMDTMNAGRFNRGQASDQVIGYRYNAILDDRTTDLCRSLHDLIFPKADPRVGIYRPPNHHQCRSYYDYVFAWEMPEWSAFPDEQPAKGFGT